MANNFRLINNDPNVARYVSKAGVPGGNGVGYYGSRDNPLPGVIEFLGQSPTNCDGIVGTGTYQWATGRNFAGGSYGSPGQNLRADGFVCIQGDSQTRYAPLCNSGSTFQDLTFEHFAGFSLRAYFYANPVYFKRCIFKVLPAFASEGNSGAASTTTFEDCVFFNLHFPSSGTVAMDPGTNNVNSNAALSFSRCLFFNCTIADDAGRVDHCYLDPLSRVCAQQASGNNVDPACDAAAGYGLNVNGAGFALAFPQGISAPPRFNALIHGDFTLQDDSPHLSAGIGPAQYRFGRTYLVQYNPGAPGEEVASTNTVFTAADGSSVPVRATTNLLDVTGWGTLVVRPAGSPGSAALVTDRVRHAEGGAQEISLMQALGGYNFDASYPALESQFNPNSPEVFNNNVPDVSIHAAGDPGRNPNRLSYLMRWSTLPNPRLANAEDWVTGDHWLEFEWNTQPLYNPVTNLGNGRAEFVVADGQPVLCTWYQLHIGLTNTYYR